MVQCTFSHTHTNKTFKTTVNFISDAKQRDFHIYGIKWYKLMAFLTTISSPYLSDNYIVIYLRNAYVPALNEMSMDIIHAKYFSVLSFPSWFFWKILNNDFLDLQICNWAHKTNFSYTSYFRYKTQILLLAAFSQISGNNLAAR